MSGEAPSSTRAAVDPFADWESMFESGELDASLKHLDLSRPPPPLPGGQRVILKEREEGRSEYQPPEPQLKIMKRPDGGAGRGEAKERPRAQQKSLKQREQEYAEARQRILGRAEEEEPAPAPAPAKPQVKVAAAGRGRAAPLRTDLPPPALPAPQRIVASYSAQRQFRVPPPSMAPPGPPPPLEVCRAPRGPPPEGGRGFPGGPRR